MDSVALSVSVLDDAEEEEEETKVSEIKDGEDESPIQGDLTIDAFAVGGFGAGMKKLTMSMENSVENHLHYLITARKYAKIIDFDDHFHDISLDWRNEEFNA